MVLPSNLAFKSCVRRCVRSMPSKASSISSWRRGLASNVALDGSRGTDSACLPRVQFATDLESAEARVKAARRTNSVFMGVGSKADGEFVAMEYAHDNVTVWTDTTGPS